MKSFFAFIQKEFYHILRDRRTLFILLAMPVALVLIFGYAVTNEFRGAAIGILDQAKDPLSLELVQHLQASGHFELVRHFQKEADIHHAFREDAIKLAFIIPPDFTGALRHQQQTTVRVIADGADPNTASLLVSYAQGMLAEFQQGQNGSTAMQLPIRIEPRMLYNPSMKSVYLFVPGVIALILMLISAMMTSLTLAREKETGTMELLLASPLPPPLIIIGKVMPYVLIALTDAILILLVGVFVFKVPIQGNLVLLLATCVLFIITSLALGILISTRTNTQQAALMGSLIVLMMPSILLSGFIFPIESMPWILQQISQIIPARWFITVLRDVMLKGAGLGLIWVELLILTGMTLFFFLISLRNFKIRLE